MDALTLHSHADYVIFEVLPTSAVRMVVWNAAVEEVPMSKRAVTG
jgi:hypothetical protein